MSRIIQNHHVLAVHDVKVSAKFYVDVLGFAIVNEPPGWIFVQKDNCMIMLGECPDDMHPSTLGCHSYYAYLVVDDVDDYHAQVAKSGIAHLPAPVDKPWGMREFAVTSVDGHRLMIGQMLEVH